MLLPIVSRAAVPLRSSCNAKDQKGFLWPGTCCLVYSDQSCPITGSARGRIDVIADRRLTSDRFPRASAYHPEWALAAVSSAANALWLTEWLTEALDLRPGMRVLDLGCGRATSSVFLHREFGVQVWATDLWFSASESLQRIRDAGVENTRSAE